MWNNKVEIIKKRVLRERIPPPMSLREINDDDITLVEVKPKY